MDIHDPSLAWLFSAKFSIGLSLFHKKIYDIVTPTPGPVSPIGCSVGISGPPGGVTDAAPVPPKTGCLAVRIWVSSPYCLGVTTCCVKMRSVDENSLSNVGKKSLITDANNQPTCHVIFNAVETNSPIA